MRLSPVVQSLTEPLLSPLVSAITGVFGGGYSPTSLFADGSKGVVYDNNDFVDSATWRRNLLTYSEQFDNAYWNKASANVTANSAVAPDGTTTADTITASAASGYAFPASNIFASAGGNTYTYSVYAKAGTSNVVTLLCAAASTYNATFNLATQVVSSVSANAQASMVSVGSGWFRLILTCNSVANNVYTELQNGRIANGTTIFLWGAQLETGSTATTYQRITDFNSDFLAAFPGTTLFLDSAGTVPATVNGLVGLQLDKSANLALGAETLANGGFDSDTVWTKGTDWTISGGVASKVAGVASSITQDVLTSGKWYEVTITVTRTAGAWRLDLGGAGGAGISQYYSASGTYTIRLNATGNRFYIVGDATFAGSVDSVSCRELPGNHRYQTTTGSKPVLRGTPTGSNLVTNGDFATDTVWTKDAGWTISSGTASKAAGSAANIAQSLVLDAGRIVRVSYTIASISGGAVFIRLIGGAVVDGASRTTAGTFVEYLTVPASMTSFAIRGASTTVATIDNIEVVDVSAGQVTAPYGLQYDGVDDFMQTAAVDFATATSDGLERRNLLTFPSAFDNAAWTKGNITVTANSVASPDGTVTADTLNEGVATNYHNLTAGSFSAGTYTISVYAKNVDAQYVNITLTNSGLAYCSAIYDVSNGTVASSGALASGFSVTSTSITSVGDGWYRCVMTCVIASTSQFNIGLTNSTTIGTFGLASYTGTSRSIYVWGAQVEAGSTASAFQNIGTDKMFVCAGMRKLSDAAVGALVELSSNVTTNAGAFAVFAPLSSGLQNFNFQSAGSALSSVSRNDRPAPTLRVLTCIGNISGDIASLTVSGDATVTSTADQGTGNYGNYALYFGRRAGTSLPYNGLDFGMVICGKTITSTQIANTERWMSYRTGVTL